MSNGSKKAFRWLERGGTTRSHPEHGSETPQRRRYCPGNGVWKICHCREAFLLYSTVSGFSRAIIPMVDHCARFKDFLSATIVL